MNEHVVVLSSEPAEQSDRRRALAVVVVSLLIFAAAVPFVRHRLPEVWAFIPIYESALIICDLITAVMLFGHYRITRSRALLLLADGYLITATLAVPHALTFPGLFAPTGLLGAGPQSTAWLYMLWHGAFPLAVIGYALFKSRGGGIASPRARTDRTLLLNVLAVLAIAAALTALATAGQTLLPAIMRGNNYTPAMIVVVSTVWALSLVALGFLWWRRPHTVLDLWLMVVMCAWMIDVALSAVLNGGRFDLGFYAGRIYGLMAAATVLIVLLLETMALYAQLAGLFAAEQRERMLEAEERRRIFETSLDLILVVDRQGTFLRVSPSATAILGYEPDALIGRNAIEFVHADDLDAIRAEMRQARRGKLIRDFAVRYAHKDGRIVTLAWSGVWSEPEQRHYFIGRDVTEQKRIERMKDEFISTVNHELRTPLTTIMGPLELLARIDGLPETAKRLVVMAQDNSQRLVRVIGEILDFDSLRSGRMAFNFRRVEVKSLLQRAVEAQRPAAEKLGVGMRLDVSATDAVDTDADRLAQVVDNLLSNAIKFSPAGGEVVVSTEPRGGRLRIAVRDQGPGVPEAFRTRLFERFAVVDATDARLKGGAGLGLSIVKQTMIRLGGDVGHAPAPAGGSIFYVDVPRWDADALAAPRPGVQVA